MEKCKQQEKTGPHPITKGYHYGEWLICIYFVRGTNETFHLYFFSLLVNCKDCTDDCPNRLVAIDIALNYRNGQSRFKCYWCKRDFCHTWISHSSRLSCEKILVSNQNDNHERPNRS